jgi:hypothetical protein
VLTRKRQLASLFDTISIGQKYGKNNNVDGSAHKFCSKGTLFFTSIISLSGIISISAAVRKTDKK